MIGKRMAPALALAAGVLAAPAQAGYFGLAVSQNTFKQWDDVGDSLDDGSFTSQSSDDKGDGFRVFLGFGGNETFSFEFGYSDFGKASFKAESDGSGFWPAGPMSVTASPSGLDLAVVGKAPVGESVTLFGRLGVVKWSVDSDASIGGQSGSGSDDGSDIFFGGGVEFGRSGPMSVRAEYAKYSFDDADLDSMSLSLIFRGGN